jgi:hypothetical protein
MEKMKLYTMGYTLFQNRDGINVDKMFKYLKNLNVTHLLDVRSQPYSKQFPECNYNNLKGISKNYLITYGHIPELGAKARPQQDVFTKASEIFKDDIFPIPKSNRPDKIELFADEEIIDFKKFRGDDFFIDGIKRIQNAYEMNFTVTLMCSEKRPIDCHRFFLISKKVSEFFGDWIEIFHISIDKNDEIILLSNEEVEKELSREVFKKKEIIKLDVVQWPTDGSQPKIEKYLGITIDDKINDFCDRYWNLLHGWK